MAATTLTVQLSEETREKLTALAAQTKRSTSTLAGEAIAAYVERELAIIDGIERGLADRESGRVIPHDEAAARIRDTIRKAAQEP